MNIATYLFRTVIWLIRVHHGIKVGVKRLIERFTDTPGQEGV